MRKYVGDNATLASDVGASSPSPCRLSPLPNFPTCSRIWTASWTRSGSRVTASRAPPWRKCSSPSRGAASVATRRRPESLWTRRDPLPDVNESKPLMDDPDDEDLDEAGHQIRAGYVTGWSLVARQCKGLLWKRRLNWQRDWKSILVQLAFPVLFFVLALVARGLGVRGLRRRAKHGGDPPHARKPTHDRQRQGDRRGGRRGFRAVARRDRLDPRVSAHDQAARATALRGAKRRVRYGGVLHAQPHRRRRGRRRGGGSPRTRPWVTARP